MVVKSEVENRARYIAVMAMRYVGGMDSLTMYGAEGSALLELVKDPWRSSAEIAWCIASNYRNLGRDRDGWIQGGLFE